MKVTAIAMHKIAVDTCFVLFICNPSFKVNLVLEETLGLFCGFVYVEQCLIFFRE